MAYKRCWQCSKDVSPSERYCERCGADQWGAPEDVGESGPDTLREPPESPKSDDRGLQGLRTWWHRLRGF